MTSPSTHADVVIRTYGPGPVPPLLDVVADIWADSHPELVDNPEAEALGLSVSALHRQITGHLKRQVSRWWWHTQVALPLASATRSRAVPSTGSAPAWSA